MGNNIPCIISEEVAAGIPGVINKENIFIAYNTQDYIRHFKFIINNPNEVKLVIRNAYNLVKEKYSWERHSAVIENIWLNEVVKSNETND